MAHFSKELPRQQNGSLGPVTFRSWYEKKKGSPPVPLEDGAVELIPGNGWDKEQVGIKYELGPEKTGLYVTVSLANISLSHYVNVILKQRPIQLKVILFPVMPAVGNRPVFGPAEPVVDEVDVTIPALPQPDIDLDMQCTDVTSKKEYRIQVVATANLPPYISQADRAKVLRSLTIEVKKENNVTVKKEGVSYSDSGVTHTLIATPVKKTKPATATVVSSLSVADLDLMKEKEIQFQPGLKYLLNLSTNTVTLELPEQSWEHGHHKVNDMDDGPGRTEGSFEAWVYEVSSGKKYQADEGILFVQVADDVEKILKVHPKKGIWGHLECKLTSRGITDTHSVPLIVSAKVGDYTIPEKPTVTVFLNSPQQHVTLTIEKRGFSPCEINISKEYPSLAKEILSKGGVLEIPSIQGKCTLTYPDDGGEKEKTFTHQVWYTRATLSISKDYSNYSSDIFQSNQDEESVTISIRDQNNPLKLLDGITLDLDESFKAKLVSLKQELNTYPSKSGSFSWDDMFFQYTEEFLRLFATEKNAKLEAGLADTYAQRVANTWAFIRLGNNVHPLIGRTEEITGKTIQRASENFLNFYLQVLMCLAPRISERITGYNAPKNADDIAREAKDIVDKEMRDEWHTIMVWFEGFKKNYDDQAKALFLEIQETTGKVISALTDTDTQFFKIIDLIKKSVSTTGAATDIEQGLARISSKYPKNVPHPDLTQISLSSSPADKELKEWLQPYCDTMQKHVTESIPVVQELDVFFETIQRIEKIPVLDKQKIRGSINSFAEKCAGIDMIQLEEKILGDIVQLKKIEAMNKAVFAHIDTLAQELDLDPLNSAQLKNILETIRLQVDQTLLDKQNWESVANLRNVFESRLNMLNAIDTQTQGMRHYSDSAKRALENAILELNEVELDKAFAKVLEDGIQSFTEELLKSQPTAELYNSIVDSQRVHNPPFVFLDGWGGPTYREYWTVPGAIQGFPPVSSARDVNWEKDKPWRDMNNFFRARQDGGSICLSAIESIFRMINQACINWRLYWETWKGPQTEVISELFNKETYEKVKGQYGQWGVSEYYFGMGSNYFLLAEQGETLQKIDIIPLIPPRHEDIHKRQDEDTKKRILEQMMKPSQEERVNIINSIFYEAAKGALAPGTLSTAPEGITSADLGKLNESLNVISGSVQGFEQAYDRLEYYKQLPFLERQYTYFTNGLGEALAGTTSADADQLIEWISYWGTWGFVIGSFVFPAYKVVSWTTMATVSAGKELFGDVGLAYFQAGPLAHAELETVSGMYRDLLILFGIAYIGFFVEKVEFGQILKLETFDPNYRSTLGPDGLRRSGYYY